MSAKCKHGIDLDMECEKCYPEISQVNTFVGTQTEYITEVNCQTWQDRFKLGLFYIKTGWHIIKTGKEKITVKMPIDYNNN